MSEVRELIERVDKLDGPSREVDADLFVTLVKPGWHTSAKDPGAVARSPKAFWPEGKLRFVTRDSKPSPSYTQSLDAAIALCERVLPGWSWTVLAAKPILADRAGNAISEGPYTAIVNNAPFRPEQEELEYEGVGVLAAISLCLATLRALEAQGGEK